MAKRTHYHNPNDYLDEDDYGDYGGDYGREDYGPEEDKEAEIKKALRESEKEAVKKEKGKQIQLNLTLFGVENARIALQKTIDDIFTRFNGYFTKNSIKGSLEMSRKEFPDTFMVEVVEKYDRQMVDIKNKGKKNIKAIKEEKVAEIIAAQEEVKKAAETLKSAGGNKKIQKKPPGLHVEDLDEGLFGRSKEIKHVNLEELNQIYPSVNYFKDDPELQAICEEENSKNLNLVIIGHVDSGKSTLTGQLLVAQGLVTTQEFRKNVKLCAENNKESFEFAYIMDETEEERERGVTINLTTRFFATPNRDFTILDAPGHRDFIANMITGAAQAGCGILVLDAMKNAFESGWTGGNGTTKEHAILARSLGVTQLVCAINKLETVDWSVDRYNQIEEIMSDHLKYIGFKKQDIYFVPISGLTSENLTTRSTEERLTEWYDGPCLVEILDGLRVPPRTFTRPLRITVTEYMQKTSSALIGDCVQAKIEAGALLDKQELMIMPQNEKVNVKGIMRNGQVVDNAVAGQIVDIGLRLPPDFDINYLRRGNVLCDTVFPIPLITQFIGKIVVYDLPQGVLAKGEQVIVYSYTSKTPARISHLLATIEQSTGEIIRKKPKWLKKGNFAQIQIRLEEPMCMELFDNYKNMGRFCIRKGAHTVAAGTIQEFLS